MKIVTVLGARPQFVKASVVSKALSHYGKEILVHTGQHYDKNMSEIFFKELQIPKPTYNLGVGSATHGRQTGEMLIKTEEILLNENPDAVLVYGDTNSTLAGALAASKLHIPVAHVEAGLRSYNMRMPEEQNRVLTDHISSLLFCPTQTAAENLKKEGIEKGVSVSGDVMLDSVLHFLQLAKNNSETLKIFNKLSVCEKHYYLATIHRAETTEGGLETMLKIFSAMQQLPYPVIFPVHPRTLALAKEAMLHGDFSNIHLIEPVGYLEMLLLTSSAVKVLTDSGGLQKEAWFMQTPCVTLRSETEWIETLKDGWNVLAKFNTQDIIDKALSKVSAPITEKPFGNGKASIKIAAELADFISNV